MLTFIEKIMEHRIEQTCKSAETTKEEETNTNKNADAFIVSKRYEEVLHLSREIISLYKQNKIPKRVKKMINQLDVKMSNLFQNFILTEIKSDDILVLAMAYINLGYIYLYIEDNLNVAEDYLIKCIELSKGKEMHYKFILIAIFARIFLHEVWAKLQQFKNCYSLLDKALELYLSYTKEDDYPDPLNVNIAFPSKENSKINLNNGHLVTLKYMEKLYCFQPTNMHKFVIYIHNLLNEQLKTIKYSTENILFLCWAEASAKLSIYFLYANRFMEAKIHIAAAEYMTVMFRISLITDSDDAQDEEKIYNYYLFYMFINQLWAIYGIMLLRSSKERLLQHESNKSCEANNIESEFHLEFEEEIMKSLTFVDLEKDLKRIIKYHITDTCVSDLNDIKIIFGSVLKWLDEIFIHFRELNQYIPLVKIILCMSEAYKCYVYFVGSKRKQIKVIEVQTKMLKDFINTLSLEYNASPEYHYLKKLNFELAITYSTLLNIMSEELDEIEEITDEMRMEMRQLVTNIIHEFNLVTNLS